MFQVLAVLNLVLLGLNGACVVRGIARGGSPWLVALNAFACGACLVGACACIVRSWMDEG